MNSCSTPSCTGARAFPPTSLVTVSSACSSSLPRWQTSVQVSAQGLFRATRLPGPGARGPGGSARNETLGLGRLELKVVVPTNAKSGLRVDVAAQLLNLGPRTRTDANEDRVTRLGIVFDPDADAREVFENDLLNHVSTVAEGWIIRPAQKHHRWTARRVADGYRLIIHAVAWRAASVTLAALPDWSNLERLLCGVAARAYPDEAKLVERWLGEMDLATHAHPWKAALHLWCALVEAKSDEHSAPARFLHQNKECMPHAEALLGELSLLSELRPLLAPP